ncbi:uncharacterized protein LOC142974180 [Anticarsia gemmatalis]|uniref:uncharacterized protein LOC142974180 n=1 Tax=Anticarsia gemmatalis TaxID=129554 RepID=UPI003F771EC4
MRIYGLDDSTSPGEVAIAVARAGGCLAEIVKVSEIRRNPWGLGSTWVTCPVTAAKKIAESGKLLVGWVSARVTIAEPRPLRCFRCFSTGHAQAMCQADKDRSNSCYRCGLTGHKIAECTADRPRCLLCAEAKKPADHRLGGPACKAPKSKGGKVPKNTAGVRASQSTINQSGTANEEVAMITDQQ